MKNIIVLHYNLNNLGGSQKVAVTLANELVSYFNVTLISTNSSINMDYSINDSITSISLEHYSKIKKAKMVKKYIKDNQIDCLVFIGTGSAYILSLMGSIPCKVIVSEQRNIVNRDFVHGFKMKFNKFMTKHKSNKIVTLTEEDANGWESIYSIPKEKLTVIHNWCDYVAAPQWDDNRKNWILTCGTFEEIKGYDYLVEVAKLVFQEKTDFVWHVYAGGENSFKDNILGKINDYHLENKLIIHKPIKEIEEVYKKSKLFVLTSRHEGLPLTLIEAKFSRIPSVAFNCMTGPAEIIRNNIDGILINNFNVEEMASKILSLIQNPDKLFKYAEETSNDLKRFKKEPIVQQWVDLINKTIEE